MASISETGLSSILIKLNKFIIKADVKSVKDEITSCFFYN